MHNGNKSVSPTPRLLSGIPFSAEIFKTGEKGGSGASSTNSTYNNNNNNNNNDIDDDNSNIHPSISLINNMNGLVLALSNTLDETLIRLEELQSIGLNQLQPAIEECGNTADPNVTTILQDKYDELQECFDQIDTVEDMIATIDLNLNQHEWRFNQLRALYVDELGLPPQSLNVVNDSIARMEEFEILTQSANNFQKRVNSFGDWVSKSVKDRTQQIRHKSKDMPKAFTNTANTMRMSFNSLFKSGGNTVGTGTPGVGYDGYAEAKEDATSDSPTNTNANNNNNDATMNGSVSNTNDNSNNDDKSNETSNVKTWPLKPEEIEAREKPKLRHPFGGFSSLRNVTFTGTMSKMKENISKNVTNITKKLDSTSSSTATTTATTNDNSQNESKNNENNENKDSNESKEEKMRKDSKRVPPIPQLQARPSIKDIFKIKDRKYTNEIEGM